jgi:SagB-type dehydrogenase family enzyme
MMSDAVGRRAGGLSDVQADLSGAAAPPRRKSAFGGWESGDVNLEAGAGLLHRLTSYAPEREWNVPMDDPRLRHDLVPNDLGTLPPPIKSYPDGLEVLDLPRELPEPQVSATAVLAGVPSPAQPLDAAQLGRVLFLGAGVVRTGQRDGRRILFRAAGSAGARFPLEVYVSARGVSGVPDAVYWYDPERHALVRIAPAAAGAVSTLIVTGVPWRTGWRYAERGWRHLYWDAGTLLAQLSAAADSAGLAPRLRSLFPDAAVRDLVGADGVHEYPLALLSLGDGEPAIGPAGPAIPGRLPEVELPLCTEAQRAGERDTLGEPWPGAPALPEVPASASLDEVVRRRGSQRRMNRSRTLPPELLRWPLAAALRGIEVPHWVAVHGVDGVVPGLYRWPDLTRPLRAADLRDELLRICLDQALAADAAYVVIAALPLAGLDDRGYRDAQLAAGLVEGRLHLAAYALGVGASGMTFLDAEVPDLLGERDPLAALLFTCVGVPEYRSRAGGGPGAPVAVRTVTPRLGNS